MNFISKLWEQMHNIWKERNKVKHRKTQEEIHKMMRKIRNPQVRAAYKTRETAASLFNHRLLWIDLGKRISMSPQRTHNSSK